jgi:hypothetical protein
VCDTSAVKFLKASIGNRYDSKRPVNMGHSQCRPQVKVEFRRVLPF